MAIVVLACLASGAAGYYLANLDRKLAAPLPHPVWTDRELRSIGTDGVAALRCTYHFADGTVRVSEPRILRAIANNTDVPACPPSP